MREIKYWVFKHKPGKNADESECLDFIMQAIKNNYAFMQYEYGMEEETRMVTLNWNRILEIKEGDVIFLRGDANIYAFGHAIRPRLQSDIELNAKEIIRKREHGKYNSSEYRGIIHFSDSDVFYENLEGEEQWGQRIDVDSWQLYYANGIPAKSQDLYQQGENEYGVLKELKPEKGQELINQLYKSLGMKNDILKILQSNYNLILTGAPGTGKTYLTRQIARLMLFGKVNEEELNETEKQRFDQQFDFVQFHPSYDYTDFVEGLRPIDDEKRNISFRREDGIFMSFCRKALSAYTKAKEQNAEVPKYIFVIDEINRGDLSKIFGELFFSIDPGYRGEKGKVKTQYCNLWKTKKYGNSDSFYIPENVYIIGTMNDIDRSVESMDFAMRRRFAFKEVHVEDRMEMIEKNSKLAPFFTEIKERMNNLNYAILTIQGLSTAYQIGAAYFLKLENYLTNEKVDDNSWSNLWDNHLSGLLFEYLRGLPSAEEDLVVLRRAYNLKDKYKMENVKAIKESSQNA